MSDLAPLWSHFLKTIKVFWHRVILRGAKKKDSKFLKAIDFVILMRYNENNLNAFEQK